jgi:hypothetical protein
VSQELEAGAPEHLPFDHFRLRVDALCSPVVVRERERGGGGLDVEFQAAGEGVHVRQAGSARVGDPLAELVLIGGVGVQHGGEGGDQAGQGFHLRAGRCEPSRRPALSVGQVVRPGQQDLRRLARG